MFLWLFVFIGAHVGPTYLSAIWDNSPFNLPVCGSLGQTFILGECNALWGECERVAWCTTVSWYHLFLLAYTQACSQDFYKGGYVGVWCVCMYNQAKLGGSGGMLPKQNFRYQMLCMRLLLKPFGDRSRAVVAVYTTWLTEYCIQFLAVYVYAFAKPADIKFPREKVLWLTEQQVGWKMVK